MSNSLRPHGLYSPGNSPGQNTGVGSLSLLRGIVPAQGSNPGLRHCRWILYQLSHKGSLLAIVNSAAMNIGVHVSFSIIVSSECMPSSRIAGSYGSFIPVFKGIPILFSIVTVISLHFHQHHSSKISILWPSAFFMVQLSHPYMTTGKS